MEGNELKIACVTEYGTYKFKVMPYNLTHTLTTFCTLMNRILQSYLNQFLVVYFDDIVVYSNTLKEYAKHLQAVFKVLQDNELYGKQKKSSLAKLEVDSFGHNIIDRTLFVDKAKVKVIAE